MKYQLPRAKDPTIQMLLLKFRAGTPSGSVPQPRRDLRVADSHFVAQVEEGKRRETGMTGDEDIIAKIYEGAAAGSCVSTRRGLVWYCDLHDTHGNADTQEEAEFVAAAHGRFFQMQDPDDEPCDLYIEQAGAPPD